MCSFFAHKNEIVPQWSDNNNSNSTQWDKRNDEITSFWRQKNQTLFSSSAANGSLRGRNFMCQEFYGNYPILLFVRFPPDYLPNDTDDGRQVEPTSRVEGWTVGS